jgi:DNA-binding transcriptional LysR family regulator
MRQILALEEFGSFARAAVALHMSQPALSRSVQSVERQVGNQLFVRSASGVEPTDIGRILILRARQILQLSEDLDRDIVSDRALQSGHVSVGGGPYPAQSTLSAALARFLAAYPRVTVRLVMRDWDELLRRLRGRDLELFVGETSTLHGESDIEMEAMPEHPLFFAARSGHPLAGRGAISAVDTFSYPFVSLSRISPRVLEPMREAQRRSPDPAAVTRVFPALECNALSAIKQIVLGSDAIMAATLGGIEAELERGELALLGSEPWLHLRYGIVRLKGHPLSTAAGRFREYVVEAERALALDEERLLARWRPKVGRRAAAIATARDHQTRRKAAAKVAPSR